MAATMSHPNCLTAHRICVLLVDDQAIIGQALARMLETATDIDFHYCQDPTLAIRTANQVAPTVILQDLVMPEFDGLGLVKYFRANPSTRNIPLIVLSSKEEADIKAEAFRLGANDYLVKLPDPLEVIARIRYHSSAYIHLLERNEAIRGLEKANQLIRKTFGRYLSDDIVEAILDSPQGLALGGEKRWVTILMSDLRGFTSISERLPAEHVVAMINIYLEVMTDILLKYQGTIDEFIGDAILAIFGAPLTREDDAMRAVACALEMQLAMQEVNRRNREAGYPSVAMGIGINTGELVVGNIGGAKRVKYGVVGQNVNLTSRIESYTIGGQILIAGSTLSACGDALRIDDQFEIHPKGVTHPLRIVEVGGIAAPYHIYLPEKPLAHLYPLATPLSLRFTVLAGKYNGQEQQLGQLLACVCLSECNVDNIMAELATTSPLERLSNLKVTFPDTSHDSASNYAKVTAVLGSDPPRVRIVFTTLSPEAQTLLLEVCGAAKRAANTAINSPAISN